MDISTIGRYQILERLGQGGMGVVYRAFDPQIERTVAIKVISAQLVDQPEQRERFFREARAAGRLAHRNIITIFDLGEDRGQPYIAMEYVQGQALDVRMRTGEPLTLSQKLAIIADICDALAFAHGAGIIHRDMKPANVMLTTTGSVRILDFGLARLVTSELTRSNIVVGTMNYMAPEQVRAEPIDHRADVFSVGVLLYELLSGRKAFEADSFAATMYKVLQDRPAPLESLGHALPAELMTVVDRAIEKDREQRYQSMGDMLLDLQLVRAALPPAAPFRVFDSHRRRPAGIVSAWVGTLVTGVGNDARRTARARTGQDATSLPSCRGLEHGPPGPCHPCPGRTAGVESRERGPEPLAQPVVCVAGARRDVTVARHGERGRPCGDCDRGDRIRGSGARRPHVTAGGRYAPGRIKPSCRPTSRGTSGRLRHDRRAPRCARSCRERHR